MPEPRKHHYLPQFYLRGFSTNGRSIYQIEKQGLSAYTTSIRDAAAIRDYHELDDPHFEDPNAVEKRLAEIEGQLASAVARIIQSGATAPDTHTRLLEFVALMRVRIPAFKAYIDAFLQQVVRSVGLIMERKGALPPAPKGLEAILHMENLSISISNWKCLEFMFSLAADRRVLDILAAMKLSVLRAPEGALFLTCDQPVALYHPTASPADAYGVGLADPAVELSLPLSGHTLITLSWVSDAPGNRVLTSGEVAEFNRRTVVMASSLVFAPEEAEWALKTVRSYSHCSAGIDLTLLDAGSEAVHLARVRPVMRPNCYPTGPPNSPLQRTGCAGR